MRCEDDPAWAALLDALRTIARVEHRDPSGLVVTMQRADGTSSVVEIVVTPDQWDELVGIMWAAAEPALLRLQELAAQHPDGIIPGGRWCAHPPRQSS